MFYEEFQVGQQFQGPGITVTEAHVVLFGSITGDLSPGHMNQEYMQRGPFGGRIAHGMLTASMAMASVYPNLSRHTASFLGANFTFRDPVFLGDTVRTTLEVVGLTSKSQWGLVKLKLTTTNQHGRTVMEGEAALALRYRPPGR